jgi:diguanylate cyclase (GGDEF)-like protein
MDGYLTATGERDAAQVQHADVCPQRTALTQAVLDRVTAGLVRLDADLHVILCNHSAAEMLGLTAPELWCPVPFKQLLARSNKLDGAGRITFEAALRAAVAPAHSNASDTGDRLAKVSLTDRRMLHVTVSRTAEGCQLATLAIQTAGVPAERIDGLTNLSDRQWFRERVDAMLMAPDQTDQVAVLMIDLDHFKAVNDSHGHPVGDALLQAVARRLRSAMRDGDVVSRLGGDEFAVAMPAGAAAESLGARLVDLLSRPYLIDGHVAIIGASVGIALGPRDGTDTAALVRAADLALYQAKEDGRHVVRVFEQGMDVRARARHLLLDDLRCALALHQFEIHYQPQINLASRELVGFEALVRWRHPKHGLVPPDRFIPLAEEMSLIVGIGEWVLRTACREAMSWPGQLTVAVNVSAKQLADQDRLPRVVQATLAATGLAARRLEVEITESALIRYEKEALHVLHALRAMGVRVSMDDFGTGYSSLSQLRSFPFDKLKIDRSFVRDLSGSDEAVAVVRAIAALGASLGMTTTAEGVETPEQEAMIRADGCTDMQGYLISRPVPAGDVAALIERFGAAPAPNLENAP